MVRAQDAASAKDEVTDPSDWLNTSLSSLATLDSALRCQVCKEFYDTPMVTSCSHTFCSLCIRRCLSNDGQCPTCRSPDQPSKLRRNWTVQETVDAFVKARCDALVLARRDEGTENPKRKRRRIDDGRRIGCHTVDSIPPRQTRSQALAGREASTAQFSSSIPPSQEVIALDSEDEEDQELQPELEPEPEQPNDGLVACPMCNKRMKEEAVFLHLDRCDGKIKETPPPPKESQRITPQTIPPPTNHLPHLNYNLLKDNALKKKLQELGIPAWGNRQLLIRRHTQWVDIFNANSDSPKPNSNRELLRNLDVWERTQGGNAPGQGQSGPTGVMRKDFDGTKWTGRHKGQFDDLIAQARARRPAPPPLEVENNVDETSELMDGVTSSKSLPRGPPQTSQPSLSTNTATAQGVPASSIESPVASMLHSAAQDVRRRNSVTQSPATPLAAHTPIANGLQENTSDEEKRTPTTLPEKLATSMSSGTRRMPMFQVPEDPIHDVEGLGAATCGG